MHNPGYYDQATGWWHDPSIQGGFRAIPYTQGNSEIDVSNTGLDDRSGSRFAQEQSNYYSIATASNFPNAVHSHSHSSPAHYSASHQGSHQGLQRSHNPQQYPPSQQYHRKPHPAQFVPEQSRSANSTASSQSAMSYHQRESATANHLAPQRQMFRHADQTGLAGYGQGQMPSQDHGGLGGGSAAAPVASQLANLAITSHSNNRANAGAAPPPFRPIVQNLGPQPAPPSAPTGDEDDSDCDILMPDASDLMRSVRPVPPSKTKEEGKPAVPPSKPKPNAPTPTVSVKTPKSASKAKSATKVDDEKAQWSFEEVEALVRYIANSDKLFKRSQAKGVNTSFWKQMSDDLCDGKRMATSVRYQWKKAEQIYTQIKAFESFTGGDGDGEWTIDDDDDEETVLQKLGSRIDHIRKRKPNLDQHRQVTSAKMYRSWTHGGGESLYTLLHMRFKDMKAFNRESHRRSGSITPSEPDTDTDNENTSKSDTNGSSRDSAKAPANKNGKLAGIKSGVDSMASAAQGIIAAKQASATAKEASSAAKQLASDSKNTVAMQRLEFERSQADVTNRIALENQAMRRESMRIQLERQKRKLSTDRIAAEREEEDAKRRRTMEDKAAAEEAKLAQQQFYLARINALNLLVADPATDDEVRLIYKAQISSAATALGNL